MSPLLNIPKKAPRTLLLPGYGHLRWRQRLLENNTLDLKTMFGQARSLELPMQGHPMLAGRCGRNNSPWKESVAGKKDNSGCQKGFEV